MKALTNIFVLVLLAAAGYYGYSNFTADDDASREAPPDRPGFNCRGAVSSLARLYECRDSSSCTLTTEQEGDLIELETNIERFCN